MPQYPHWLQHNPLGQGLSAPHWAVIAGQLELVGFLVVGAGVGFDVIGADEGAGVIGAEEGDEVTGSEVTGAEVTGDEESAAVGAGVLGDLVG